MKPRLGKNGSVIALSAENAATTFEQQSVGCSFVIREGRFEFDGKTFNRTTYTLVRCATTGEGGLKVSVDNGSSDTERLLSFYPTVVSHLGVRSEVPQEKFSLSFEKRNSATHMARSGRHRHF